MKTAKFECPSCQQRIETDLITARKGIRCPGCGTGFIPHDYAPPPTPTQINQAIETTAAQKIKRQAESFCTLAGLFGVAGLVGIGFGLVGSAPMFLTCGAALLGVAFWLYLVGQIIHIRANTEK